MTYGNGNGIESRTLARDNTSARFSYILLDINEVKRRIGDSGHRDKILTFGYGNVGNVRNRPRNKRRVSVFAENIGVNIALIDVVILGKSGTKTRRVKNCTRTYDVISGIMDFVMLTLV